MQNSEKRRRVLFPMQDVCTSANLKFSVRQIARVDTESKANMQGAFNQSNPTFLASSSSSKLHLSCDLVTDFEQITTNPIAMDA